MSSDEHEALILSGLSRDDLLTIKDWQLDVEHPITSREEAILGAIDGALRGDAASRWAAFTDDELWHLVTALEVSFDGGMVDPDWDFAVEKGLTADIHAEIERRKGEA